jgi:uncharacterized membrane protein YbhN (UPF0104 family)
VSPVVDAIDSFLEYVGSIGWSAVVLALLCHLGKIAARTRAWHTILAAAYPDAPVRWRSVGGAYVAGQGVNAILPARSGDLVKLYLVKDRVDGATYPTLAASLVVLAVFDVVAGLVLVAWALKGGVLPGLDVVSRLPSLDWLWLFQNPRLGAVTAVVLLLLGFALGLWAAGRVDGFRTRARQGFAVLGTPGLYLRGVVAWQVLDWGLRLATISFFLVAFRLDAGVHEALLVQVAESLSTVVPLTPAGVGTEQALLVYVFAGEQPGHALLSFSVGMKLILIACNVALAGVALALLLRTVRWRPTLAAAAALPLRDVASPQAKRES